MSDSRQQNPTLACLREAGIDQPMLDDWLEFNGVEGCLDAELLDVLPAELCDEYVARLSRKSAVAPLTDSQSTHFDGTIRISHRRHAIGGPRHDFRLPLALIGNASAHSFGVEQNRSEAFSIRRLEGRH
jgi:hypothetical protein